jgi:hypothetical protein
MPPTTPVHVRINSQNLEILTALGQLAEPKPLNRSEMINVAVAKYVEKASDRLVGKPPRRPRKKG